MAYQRMEAGYFAIFQKYTPALRPDFLTFRN